MSGTQHSFSSGVARGVFWVSVGAFAVRVIGVLTSVFLFRTFSLHEYGTYQLVLSVAGLLALVTLQGIDEVILAAGAKSIGENNVGEMRNLLRGYWIFKMGTGILLWAFILFASEFLHRWYSEDILRFLQTYAWVFLLLPFERVILFSFSIRRMFAHSSFYGFVQEALKLALIFVFVSIFQMGINGILLGMIFSMCATILLFGPKPIFQLFIGWRGATWTPFIHLLRTQGFWSIGQRFLRLGEKNIRPLVIQLILGREAVALFSFAEKIYGYVAGAFPLGDVLMPTIAGESGNRERLQRILERGIKYTVPLYAFASIAIAIVAPWVIRSVFPHYEPALPVIFAVLCYVPFIGIAYLMTSFFVSHQEQELQFRAICIRAVFFLFALPVCAFLFGVVGVGIEFTVTLLFYNAIRIYFLRQKYPELSISFPRLFQIDSYDRAVFQRLVQKCYPALRKK